MLGVRGLRIGGEVNLVVARSGSYEASESRMSERPRGVGLDWWNIKRKRRPICPLSSVYST